MKKTILAAVMTIAAGSVLFAQTPGTGRGDRTPPTPEQMIDRRVQMLTNLLTLDATQQAQAKTIFTDELNASQALQDKMKAAHDALETAVKGGASDAQLDQLAAQVGTVQGQGAGIHAKAQAKFRLILTSAQKEKLDSSRPGMGGGPGWGGGRGPMGGRPRF
jgi:Spy/CpxP family protein refolding chaperone